MVEGLELSTTRETITIYACADEIGHAINALNMIRVIMSRLED